MISFPVQTVQAITGSLIVEASGKDLVPSYGDLVVVVAGKQILSPLGTHGQFYFENLAHGRHPAKLEGAEQECEFSLTVPASDAPFLRLGTIHCVAKADVH